MIISLLILVSCFSATLSYAGGDILDQSLDVDNKGYTIMRLWGTHYEMGYSHAELLGDYIVDGVNQFKSRLGPEQYDYYKNFMGSLIWKPDVIEDEFDGIVDCLAITHPGAAIDELDLKLINTYGDWGYACRSHSCWGRYTADPIQTLSTRRLDFGAPVSTINHHVLCSRNPDDGSTRWVNLAWPGFIVSATGVNEYGTQVSLHDYNSSVDLQADRMPRSVANRYALTLVPEAPAPLSDHLTYVYNTLQTFQIMTGSFINYFVPNGLGGVMVCHPTPPEPYQEEPDFYYLRTPQSVWHYGEAMITTNSWTDGTYTPQPPGGGFGADVYYNNETAKSITSHWNILVTSSSLHQFTVAYRSQGDMTIWADGKIDAVDRTPRMEWEWSDLFVEEEPIPTVSEWGMIIFTLFMIFSGIVMIRRNIHRYN